MIINNLAELKKDGQACNIIDDMVSVEYKNNCKAYFEGKLENMRSVLANLKLDDFNMEHIYFINNIDKLEVILENEENFGYNSKSAIINDRTILIANFLVNYINNRNILDLNFEDDQKILETFNVNDGNILLAKYLLIEALKILEQFAIKNNENMPVDFKIVAKNIDKSIINMSGGVFDEVKNTELMAKVFTYIECNKTAKEKALLKLNLEMMPEEYERLRSLKEYYCYEYLNSNKDVLELQKRLINKKTKEKFYSYAINKQMEFDEK